jgi:GLPGLI family protein
MKRNLLIISLFAISLLTMMPSTKSIAGGKKGFKGTVTYSINYESDELTPAQKAFMPKQAIVKIMDNVSKEEIDYGQASQYEISDPTTDRHVIMIDAGEKKIYYKSSLKEYLFKKDSATKASADITTDLINETKIIAGFECKKAVITVTPKDTADGEAQTIIVYYCPEMGSKAMNAGDIFSEIDGLLLEYFIESGNMKITYSATEVKKGGVSAIDFMIPDDFKELSKEEFQKLMGGGGKTEEEE